MRQSVLHNLRVCLSWIRYLRRMRQEYGLGAMEEAALQWNLAEARRCADVLQKRP